MKKKLIIPAVATCLIVPAFLTGCAGSAMSFGDYMTNAGNALQNSFNHIVTEKEDLSTQQNFKFTTSMNNEMYEDGEIAMKMAETITYERSGQGANTVFVITEVSSSEAFDEDGESLGVEETTVVTTYTKFVEGSTTNYYMLEKTLVDEDWSYEIVETFADSTAFIQEVYDVTLDIFEDITEDLYGGPDMLEALIISGGAQVEGDANNCSASITFDQASFDSYDAAVQRMSGTTTMKIKDGKLSENSGSMEMSYNGKLVTKVSGSSSLVYSASVSAPTSIDDYTA